MKIEAAARLKVTAAPISTDVQIKFMTSLLKHANLKEFGFVQEKTTVTTTGALSMIQSVQTS